MKAESGAGGQGLAAPRSRPAEAAVPASGKVARPGFGLPRPRPWLIVPLLVGLLALGLVHEARTSRLQAVLLRRVARQLTFQMGAGKSPSRVLPRGPVDERLGYSRLGDFEQSLTAKGYRITRQARFSPLLFQLARLGVNPPYLEKNSAGLRISDRAGEVFFDGTDSRHRFTKFEEIPEPIVQALLFLENRELFTERFPYRNPAVEWDRLAHATLQYGARVVGFKGDTQGGSTLATQIEKYRHAPNGITASPSEKLRQIASASLRAYRGGIDTRARRRLIVLDYLNTVPLAAVPGHGEVSGLGEAMWAWFGKSLTQVRQDLAEPEDPAQLGRRAETMRQVLALLAANPAPSDYLIHNREALGHRVDLYLDLMANAGILSPALRDSARAVRLEFRTHAPTVPPPGFTERKAANAVRSQLLTLLGETRFYRLDRLDLDVKTTLDAATQRAVTTELKRLTDPAVVDQLGFRQARLLERGDPSRVTYSFTLYECTPEANLLRVQADNLGQPFDVNEGMKIDLGSTAKLRTLAHYLIIIADCFAAERAPAAEAVPAQDPIRQWVKEYLSEHPSATLEEILAAALDRRFSASPYQRFFTGGGLHTFANFDSGHNQSKLTVREAMRHSVNLVFIRMMQEIVRYHEVGLGYDREAILSDPKHPQRRVLLDDFIRTEGRKRLWEAYDRYRGRSEHEALARLLGRRLTARNLAVIYYHRYGGGASREGLAEVLRAELGEQAPDAAGLDRLVRSYGGRDLDLSDTGYLLGVQPLDLWTIFYLVDHPQATWPELADAGEPAIGAGYKWLFGKRARRAQDLRIRILLERRAFDEIHRGWQKLGYPFGSLVPSLATSIGSSADRPAALAELVGIILRGGERAPIQRIQRLHFAARTPYETTMERTIEASIPVMPREVATALHECLVDVVEHGTASRARGAVSDVDGKPLPIGGKTGSGDNRVERFARGGRLVSSKVASRTASFAFFIGDRFFGVATAYVSGPEAEGYGFTSSLPVQVVKMLGPTLTPLITSPSPPGEPRSRTRS